MYYLLEAINWMNPLVHCVGLGIAIWAFRKSQKKGYIIVAIYFALALFSLLAMPKINKVIAESRSSDVLRETEKRREEAVQEAIRKFDEDEQVECILPGPKIRFPLGPILLVTGLWLIARREKQSTEPANTADREGAAADL